MINTVALSIMCNMFIPRINNFNLRTFQEFSTERKKAVKYGLET